MALLKKLPRLFVWSQGFTSASVAPSRSAAAAADTLPRLAWPPQAPSVARAAERRRRVRHPHMAMGFVFLLILLTMLAVYATRGSTPAPYLQVQPQSVQPVLQQSGPAAPASPFWHAPAVQVSAGQAAPICLPVTGD